MSSANLGRSANAVANVGANVARNVANVGANVARNVANVGANVARNVANVVAPPSTNVGGGGIFTGTTALLLALIMMVVLFAVYYETVGYYFQLGWEGLGWSRAHGEQIRIDGPGGMEAWMTPGGGGGGDRRRGSKGGGGLIGEVGEVVDRLESDVEAALGEVGMNQVFNVSRNIYKYEDAEPLCRAFGAELATYDQVKAAYQAGGDWCNYGWSKGQMALFPTQQRTYDRLQDSESKEERESCGVPGVNGGYFPNADERFGVNCYGKRPPESDADRRAEREGPGGPESRFQHEVAKFKSELNEIAVSPFSPY